jgi:hypothetical protein
MKKFKVNFNLGQPNGTNNYDLPMDRVVVEGIFGVVEGKLVDANTPDAEVIIAFKDNANSSETTFCYNPERDEFSVVYADGTFGKTSRIFADDKAFIKGRLAEMTSLVAENPISKEEEHFGLPDMLATNLRHEIDREILDSLNLLADVM